MEAVLIALMALVMILSSLVAVIVVMKLLRATNR